MLRRWRWPDWPLPGLRPVRLYLKLVVPVAVTVQETIELARGLLVRESVCLLDFLAELIARSSDHLERGSGPPAAVPRLTLDLLPVARDTMLGHLDLPASVHAPRR